MTDTGNELIENLGRMSAALESRGSLNAALYLRQAAERIASDAKRIRELEEERRDIGMGLGFVGGVLPPDTSLADEADRLATLAGKLALRNAELEGALRNVGLRDPAFIRRLDAPPHLAILDRKEDEVIDLTKAREAAMKAAHDDWANSTIDDMPVDRFIDVALSAFLAALKEDGLKLVGREASEEMCNASGAQDGDEWYFAGPGHAHQAMTQAWRRMWDAAPDIGETL